MRNILLSFRPSPNAKIFSWMRYYRYLLVVSLSLVLLSLLFIFAKGLNLSIDFTGGALVEVQTREAAVLEDMREKTSDIEGISSIQLFGAPDLVLIRLSSIEGFDDKALNDNLALLREVFANEVKEIRRSELVGPTFSSELAKNSVIAMLMALLIIMGYVWIRFEWQPGLTAVTALLHDVIIVLGVYALFAIPFSLQTVAAVLAVAGYSINDTVVLFDRLREVRRKYKKADFKDCVNRAIQESLSRTFMTSFTTLLAVSSLLFFGGPVLREFIWALFAGVIVGTFSSVSVALGLLCTMKNVMDPNEVV